MEQKFPLLHAIVAALRITVEVNTEYVQLANAITYQKNMAHMNISFCKPKHKL
jgi:hypothetical protein